MSSRRYGLAGIALVVALAFCGEAAAADGAGCAGDAKCLARRAADLIRTAEVHATEPHATLLSASSVLAALGDIDEAEKTIPSAATILGPKYRSRGFGRSAVAVGRSDPQRATKLVEKGVAVLDAAVKRDRLSTNEDQAVTDVARGLLVLGRSSEALALLNRFPARPSYLPSSLGILAGTAYRLGRKDEGDALVARALQMASTLPHETDHSLALEGVVEGLFAAGRLEQALHVLVKIVPSPAGPGIGTSAASVRTSLLRRIASRLAVDGKFLEARAVLVMCDPEPRTWQAFTAFAKSLAKHPSPGKFSNDLKLVIGQVRAQVPRDKINPSFLGMAGAALVAAGDAKQGHALLGEAMELPKTSQDSSRAYASIAHAYALAGNFDLALKIVDGHIPRGQPTSRIDRWSATKGIALAAFRKGQGALAEQILSSADDPSTRDYALMGYAAMKAKADLFAEAESIADTIGSAEIRAETYVDIAVRSASREQDQGFWIVVDRNEMTLADMPDLVDN